MNATKLLVPLALILLAPAPVRVGPPTICVPLDIGDARSIPLPGDKGAKPLALGDLAGETLAVLAAGQDPEVHFETLRRAALTLMGPGRESREASASAAAAGAAIAEGLRRALIECEARPGSKPTERALAWFDLGLWLLDLRVVGHEDEGSWELYLDRADRMAGEDAGLQVCLFAANFGERAGERWRPNLRRLSYLVKDPDTRTARNLLRLTKHFLSVDGLDALRERFAEAEGKK
ncbi:MAG: hypothetical protein R3F30_03355 [Planctomycetota bacterium]